MEWVTLGREGESIPGSQSISAIKLSTILISGVGMLRKEAFNLGER